MQINTLQFKHYGCGICLLGISRLFVFSPHLCPNFLLLEAFSGLCLPQENLVYRKLRGHCLLAAGNSVTLDCVGTKHWSETQKRCFSLKTGFLVENQSNYCVLLFVLVTNLYLSKLLMRFQSQTHSLTQISIQVLLRQRFYLKT